MHPHGAAALTFICAVVFLLVGARLQAEEDVDTAMARLADGGMQTGSLLSISEDSIRLSDHRVALANVVRLDFQGRADEVPRRTTLIQLINGDRVAAGLTNMVDEAVIALWKSHPKWLPVRIPTETIAGVLMAAPAGPAQRRDGSRASSAAAPRPTSCCCRTETARRGTCSHSIRRASGSRKEANLSQSQWPASAASPSIRASRTCRRPESRESM